MQNKKCGKGEKAKLKMFFHSETATTKMNIASKIGLNMINKMMPSNRMPSFLRMIGGVSPFRIVAAWFH